MDALKQAVRDYATRHRNTDGLTLTPVPGLRMMCVEAPTGEMHSIYRPLVCLVLQGAKHMVVGTDEQVFVEGQSVIVSADMPVAGRILRATSAAPYLAVAVELDMAILGEVAAELGEVPVPHRSETRCLFVADTDKAALDCATRLLHLLDHPDAVPILRPGIMRELHYWLLAGKHGAALRSLALPDSHASRLGRAVAVLRAEYRTRIPVERLADAAAMSLRAFHQHFKQMTSLTPGQYQKRLRLVEARRLMRDEGLSSTQAAFEVGYESVSHFTREYGRMFGAPPKRDSLRIKRSSSEGRGWVDATLPARDARTLSARTASPSPSSRF